MNNRNINITITGSNNKGKELVSNVVTKALVAEGFVNVALVTPHGEPMVGSDVPSLLEVMKQYDPKFLETTINVIGIPENQLDIENENATTTLMNNNIAVGAGYRVEDGNKVTTIMVGEAKDAISAGIMAEA